MLWTDGDGLALLSLGASQMMLQNYYVKDWAENSMLVVEVADARAWHQHVESVLAGGNYGNARAAEPQMQDWGALVTYVWDPCGVLLHFTARSHPEPLAADGAPYRRLGFPGTFTAPLRWRPLRSSDLADARRARLIVRHWALRL